MNDNIIYLDHAAATPLDDRVLEAMLPYLSDYFYNPSSPYEPALAVRRDYNKHVIAGIIGARPSELIMTAGATESINLAFGFVKGHVISSNIEHQAVLSTIAKFDHTIVAVDRFGRVLPETISKAILPTTELVSVSIANNELGTIQPIRNIAKVISDERKKRLKTGNNIPIYLHSDASQGAGQLDINIVRLGLDMLTLNSAKIYGPKQVALLYARSKINIIAQIVGGGQEQGLRSGTENVAGVIGFARALQLADRHRHQETVRLSELRDSLEKDLLLKFPHAVISGYQKKRLASHLHISFPAIDAERLVFGLESQGVLVATGSACAANKGLRSHVLEAIGLDPSISDGSLRLTLGHLSNKANIQIAKNILIDTISHEYERIK